MLALFKAEFIRYRHWAIFGLILQLFVLFYFSKLGPVLEQLNHEVTLIIIIICFTFGFIQMTLHKRKSHWTFLLQRPLKTSKIYLALATAGIMNVLIAVPIPWLVTVIGFDYFTDTIIDMRHYFFALLFAAIGVVFYLMGNFVALNASRAAILTGIGLFIIFQSMSEYILLQSGVTLLIIIYLIHLNIASFKPDFSQPLESRLSMLLLLIPMQMMIVFLLVLSTQVFYHLPKLMLSNHPSDLLVEGTLDYWRDLPVEKRVHELLKGSNIATKNWLARQTELATPDAINIHTRRFNKKGQYPFRDKNFSLDDKENNNLWVFSHDEMLLQGVNKKTGKVVGWLGSKGFLEDIHSAKADDHFTSIPFLLKDRFITTEKTIYFVDFETKALPIKASMPEGEQMIGRPQFTQGYVALVSNKQIYLFDPTDFYEETEAMLPTYSLPHPRELSKIANVDTYAMVDGFLLVYFGQNYHGFDKPGAEIFYAKQGDKVQPIYSKRFEKQNSPILIRHFEYLMSPLLYTLDATINHELAAYPDNKHPIAIVLSGDMPISINISALLLQLLSVGIVLWVSRLIRLNKKITILWVIMAGLIGIPALLSFFFVNKVRGHIFYDNPKKSLPRKPEVISSSNK